MTRDLAVFKAFGDQTRLRILFLLAERELCVCELVAVLEMPQGRISRHLAQLKHADLVTDRRAGLWIYYSLTQGNSALVLRLHDYLIADHKSLPEAREDLERLETMACKGEICVPRGRKQLALSG